MTLAENSSSSLPRITLIDTLRGIALVAMASYHFTWDLEFFGYLDPGTATQGWWKVYARVIASTFLFLAGFSLVLAHYPAIRWRSFWKRFGYVAGAAAVISVATFFATPHEWIFFGILHSIAAASLIGLAFVRLPAFVSGTVALALVLLMVVDTYLAPGSLRSDVFNPRALAWIGLAELPPRSNDFVPVFPWLAALLAGISLCRLAMARQWLARLATVQTKSNLLSKAGRHSLIVYLVHQPVLIAIVYAFSLISPAPAADPKQSYMRSCETGCVAGGNDADLCQAFCGCTMSSLANQSLLEDMVAGNIDPQTDERVLGIARECAFSTQ